MQISEIIIIFKDLNDRKEIEDFNSNKDIFITFIDYQNRKNRKKAFEFMQDWGAKQFPFAILKENDKVVKCLYSETGKSVINEIKQYL